MCRCRLFPDLLHSILRCPLSCPQAPEGAAFTFWRMSCDELARAFLRLLLGKGLLATERLSGIVRLTSTQQGWRVPTALHSHPHWCFLSVLPRVLVVSLHGSGLEHLVTCLLATWITYFVKCLFSLNLTSSKFLPVMQVERKWQLHQIELKYKVKTGIFHGWQGPGAWPLPCTPPPWPAP